MKKREPLTNFDRQVRYCVLRDIAADLLDQDLLSLREYYTILSLLSQRYLKGAGPQQKKSEEDAE